MEATSQAAVEQQPSDMLFSVITLRAVYTEALIEGLTSPLFVSSKAKVITTDAARCRFQEGGPSFKDLSKEDMVKGLELVLSDGACFEDETVDKKKLLLETFKAAKLLTRSKAVVANLATLWVKLAYKRGAEMFLMTEKTRKNFAASLEARESIPTPVAQAVGNKADAEKQEMNYEDWAKSAPAEFLDRLACERLDAVMGQREDESGDGRPAAKRTLSGEATAAGSDTPTSHKAHKLGAATRVTNDRGNSDIVFMGAGGETAARAATVPQTMMAVASGITSGYGNMYSAAQFFAEDLKGKEVVDFSAICLAAMAVQKTYGPSIAFLERELFLRIPAILEKLNKEAIAGAAIEKLTAAEVATGINQGLHFLFKEIRKLSSVDAIPVYRPI